MRDAARRTVAPAEPDPAALSAGWDETRRKADAAITDAEQAIRGPGRLSARQAALIAAALRLVGAEAARIDKQDTYGLIALEAAKAEGVRAGLEMAAGRHRAPKSRRAAGRGHLRAVPGEGQDGSGKREAALPGLAVAGTALARHSAVAKAVGVSSIAAGLVAAAPHLITLPDSAPAHASHREGTGPLASLAPASAAPVTFPVIIPAPAGRHHAPVAYATGATRVHLRLRAPVVQVRVPDVNLGAAPSPSASLSPQPPVAPSGTLDLQTMQVTADVTGHAQIVFTAVGGPVTWSVSADSPLVTFAGDDGGTLGAGQSMSLPVVVLPGASQGQAHVTITDGGGNTSSVPISWTTVLVGL